MPSSSGSSSLRNVTLTTRPRVTNCSHRCQVWHQAEHRLTPVAIGSVYTKNPRPLCDSTVDEVELLASYIRPIADPLLPPQHQEVRFPTGTELQEKPSCYCFYYCEQ